MTTQAVQDYLKAIFKLQRGGVAVTTSAIAARLGISSPSVTNMLKKLGEQGYVVHLPYQGVELTSAGRREALATIRLHRIIERYLHDQLGFSWDRVDAEAERLEHAVSQELVEAMMRVLGDPVEDPHGDPIPTRDGELTEVWFDPLSTAQAGTTLRVRRVRDRDPELLRYLGQLGLYPGTLVAVIERKPFEGPLVVDVCGCRHALGVQVCDAVFVERVEPPAASA
jgi:DtxR family transcriptional regulator, Mn-dependent transcriptional regulator